MVDRWLGGQSLKIAVRRTFTPLVRSFVKHTDSCGHSWALDIQRATPRRRNHVGQFTPASDRSAHAVESRDSLCDAFLRTSRAALLLMVRAGQSRLRREHDIQRSTPGDLT